MKGTLHTDSIPLCESSDDVNSVEVICFTIHNTNPCHQSSHTFTLYLSIVSAVDSSSDDSIYTLLSKRSESHFQGDQRVYNDSWEVWNLFQEAGGLVSVVLVC